MTFEEWWSLVMLEDSSIDSEEKRLCKTVWNVSSTLERARCVSVCRRFYLDLAHDKAADIVEELTDAIRNP